jgi:energy-coupling factor transport system permease protein
MSRLMLSYRDIDSPIHRLTGVTKLVFFLLWAFTAMLTYDTRSLLVMFLIGIIAFRCSKVRFREVSLVMYIILFFLLINNIAIFLFSPLEGVHIYGTRHDLFHLFGPYTVTAEQLFYQVNITLKYFTVIPMALLFLLTTNPSEFAASLNRIGVSYRIAYAVSIALRYIPDVQRDFKHIAFAQQARGIDLSRKEKLHKRIKHVLSILMPLIFTSLQRIDTVSSALELRGFGQHRKRTWYTARPLAPRDYVALVLIVLLSIASTILTFHDGNRFYNPFQ